MTTAQESGAATTTAQESGAATMSAMETPAAERIAALTLGEMRSASPHLVMRGGGPR